jgi:hypothetical protein
MSPVTEEHLAIHEARIHSVAELTELITHLAQAGLMATLEVVAPLTAVQCRDTQTELAASAVVVVDGAAVAKFTVAVVVEVEVLATAAEGVVAGAGAAEATAAVVAAVAANVENF